MSQLASSAGKGDRARNNFSTKFRDNYASINWSKEVPLEGICDFCGESSKLEVISNRTMAGFCVCAGGCKKNETLQ